MSVLLAASVLLGVVFIATRGPLFFAPAASEGRPDVRCVRGRPRSRNVLVGSECRGDVSLGRLLKRPRFSWTRIKGESNVQGGGGNGSIEGRGTGRGIGAAAGAGSLAPGQRWSASRKRDVVLRLLRGESLEALSREMGVEIYRLDAWRERAMAGLELG